jgi:peptidoglycan/xylan/chitin deacetylase (PgdA/CDA1 family)
VRMRWERAVLSRVAPRGAGARGRILCYHSVGTPSWGVNDVSPARLRRHLELALEAGYRFVPPEQIARTGGRPHELAITFDDGLASVATNAAPILAEYGIPWMLFVVTDWAAGRHRFAEGVMLGWREIERLAGQGVAIGSHSVSHPNFATLPPDAIEEELGASRRALAARLGSAPTAFAIPIGRSRDWTPVAAAVARAVGYETIYAESEDRRPAGTVPRTFITRFDGDRGFRAALGGAFDRWEEWM